MFGRMMRWAFFSLGWLVAWREAQRRRQLAQANAQAHQHDEQQAHLRQTQEARQVELRAQIAQLSFLQQLGDAVNQTLDPLEVANIALTASAQIAQADAGFIALYMHEQMQVTHVCGHYPAYCVGVCVHDDIGVAGQVLLQQEPIYVPDVRLVPHYYADIPETQSMIIVPLIAHEVMVGMVCLETSKPQNFNALTLDLVKLVADRSATAIDNALLYQNVAVQLESTRAASEERAHLQRVQTEMMRLASHALKNPIGLLVSYIDLLQQDKDRLPEDAGLFVDEMQRAVSRTLQIVQDILSVERLEERMKQYLSDTFDLNGLLQEVFAYYEPQAQAQGLQLHFERFPLRPIMVRGDASQIKEAVHNLIGNAIKYTLTGGSIELALHMNEDGAIVFEVSDTGIGIPEKKSAELFKPFYRVKTLEVEGTGLGLYLVKKIVERHNGRILFTSIEGEGSTFGFVLPIATT